MFRISAELEGLVLVAKSIFTLTECIAYPTTRIHVHKM